VGLQVFLLETNDLWERQSWFRALSGCMPRPGALLQQQHWEHVDDFFRSILKLPRVALRDKVLGAGIPSLAPLLHPQPPKVLQQPWLQLVTAPGISC